MPTVTERLRALTTGMPKEEAALERSLLTGIVAFEWAAVAWAVTSLGIDLANQPPRGAPDPDLLTLAHPLAAAALIGAAVLYTAWSTWTLRATSRRLLGPVALTVHGALAAALMLVDVWVYGPGNVHSQSLGSIWPFTWVFVVGLRHAGRGGFAAGLLMGAASTVGELRFGVNRWNGDDQVSAVGTFVLYALGGAVVGFASIKLREAEREIAFARARDHVARTLHDGVLQTLAVIQRRSPDPELVSLAAEQEAELREFLFGINPARSARAGATDLLVVLREVGATAHRRDGLRVEVVAVSEPEQLAATVVDAVRGAVAEALTNAAKHGRASKATVFVDADADALFVSVKDDGEGFDAAAITEGQGITSSIRARLDEVGGAVTIASTPGGGTEVEITV